MIVLGSSIAILVVSRLVSRTRRIEEGAFIRLALGQLFSVGISILFSSPPSGAACVADAESSNEFAAVSPDNEATGIEHVIICAVFRRAASAPFEGHLLLLYASSCASSSCSINSKSACLRFLL